MTGLAPVMEQLNSIFTYKERFIVLLIFQQRQGCDTLIAMKLLQTFLSHHQSRHRRQGHKTSPLLRSGCETS